MSALRAIAWGMIDLKELDKRTYKQLWVNARKELSAQGYALRYDRGNDIFSLREKRVYYGPGKNVRRKLLSRADLKTVCRHALEYIEPHNHGTTPCS
jgi:hypothetical protein